MLSQIVLALRAAIIIYRQRLLAVTNFSNGIVHLAQRLDALRRLRSDTCMYMVTLRDVNKPCKVRHGYLQQGTLPGMWWYSTRTDDRLHSPRMQRLSVSAHIIAKESRGQDNRNASLGIACSGAKHSVDGACLRRADWLPLAGDELDGIFKVVVISPQGPTQIATGNQRRNSSTHSAITNPASAPLVPDFPVL